MLSIPDHTVHRTKLADWLELSALRSPDGRVGFGTLVSAEDMSNDEQEKDIAKEDAWEEQLVLSVQDEINWRRKLIEPDYPFRIDDRGQSMELANDISGVGAVYLFCLFLSHAQDHTIIPKALAPKITNKVRNLFQGCATVAAAGFVQGSAISFGWPRPDKTAFLKALHRAYRLFGDGTPHKKPRPAAPKRAKDDGIDVIAWRHSIDDLPGTQYLLGQVASGKDWVDKSVVSDSLHFHKYWFKHPPACQHQDAVFIPFCLEPTDMDEDATYEEVIKDYMQSLGHRYGNVFYRYRIAKFVADGLRVSQNGQHTIEGVAELPKIAKWVQRYSDRLRAA